MLYLFSDNAAAQNKNMTIVQFFFLFVKSTTAIEKIIHRFPEPGRSFLPCDRCFGVIEKFLKKKDYVFSPIEYSKYILQASKSFFTIMVTQDMILDFSGHYEKHFKKVIVNDIKERFKISTYRLFQYSKDNADVISVSVSTTGLSLFLHFSILKMEENYPTLQPSSPVSKIPLPVKNAKYKAVMQLASNYVPPDKLEFYRRLKSENIAEEATAALLSGTDDDDQADD